VSIADHLKKNYISGAIDMRQNRRKNNGNPCKPGQGKRIIGGVEGD
jgi:hypothetical protein